MEDEWKGCRVNVCAHAVVVDREARRGLFAHDRHCRPVELQHSKHPRWSSTLPTSPPVTKRKRDSRPPLSAAPSSLPPAPRHELAVTRPARSGSHGPRHAQLVSKQTSE
jgi:hypothetical protein